MNDHETLLTQENIREFENSVVNDEDGMENFMGNQKPGEQQIIDDEKKKDKHEEDELLDKDEDDDDENLKEKVEEKPKITPEQIIQLKEMQEQDLFENIISAKLQTKVSNLQSKVSYQIN